MTFFSGSHISPEKYPISERQNAVFPTQFNSISERYPLTRFPNTKNKINTKKIMDINNNKKKGVQIPSSKLQKSTNYRISPSEWLFIRAGKFQIRSLGV